MLLVERLLRDFIKRSKWHVSVLLKKDAAYSDKPSRLLLREVANFERKREGVSKHIDEAIGYYQSKSGVELFTLEKEIFGLRKKVEFKDLTLKLENCLSQLRAHLASTGTDTDTDGVTDSKADAGTPTPTPVSASRFGWFSFLSKPASAVSPPSSDLEFGNGVAVVSDADLGRDVTNAAVSYPWYESDQFLAGLGVFIGVCAIYLILSYLRGDDDGDKPDGGASISGIGESDYQPLELFSAAFSEFTLHPLRTILLKPSRSYAGNRTLSRVFPLGSSTLFMSGFADWVREIGCVALVC